MELTIILCTFNRANNLKDCVERVSNQQGMDGIDWEILIVDNNSTDSTSEIARELKNIHTINIRYVFEPEQGLSYARNRGINSTDSRYLVFIDDDILVEPQWLHAIYSIFKEKDSDAVGGRIWVRSPSELPKWIMEEMPSDLGHLDYGDVPIRIDGHKKKLFGGNMAFDRRIFELIGLFDVRRGRRGEGRKWEELLKGEESDIFHRIADASGRIDYSPDAIVYHKILPHQLEKKFFRSLEFSNGYMEIMLSENKFNREISGVPYFMFRQAIDGFVKYIFQIFTHGPDRAFRQQIRIINTLGKMFASYKKANNSA